MRHERRHADRRAGPRSSGDVRGSLEGDPDAPGRDLGHPHPQRRGARRRELDRGGPGRRPPRPGDDQRLRRALRQREHGLDPRQPRAQDAGDRSCPPGGGVLAGLTELAAIVAEIANVAPERLPAVRRPVGVRAQGRRPRRGRRQGRARATSTSTRRSVGNEGRLVVSELGGKANTEIRARQLGHELEGVVDPRELSQLIKQLENEGLAFEGAEASFELLIRRQAADYAPPFRIVDYTCLVEQRVGPRAARRGDGQGRGRGRGAPHRRRRQRPGQRARRRAAQGAPGVLPGARHGPPRRLQGAHPRRRDRDGGPDARHHRLARTARATGPPWAATRTSSRPRRRRSPTRSSTRSGSPAPSSGGATSATSRPSNGQPAGARRPGGHA